MRRISKFVMWLAVAVGIQTGFAQATEPPVSIDSADVRNITEGAAVAVEHNYVFADRAGEIAKVVRGKTRAGDYASIHTAQELRKQLETDLRSINGDKHLIVSFSAARLPSSDSQPSSAEVTEQDRHYGAYSNNGFVKAERLEGNIGYLEIRGFPKPGTLRDAAAAAFGFVADTAALIVDLRRNGGGWPAGVAWISSYLFEDRVHLNDLVHRQGNRVEEFWTTPSVPGRKFAERPVYVLTSKDTFSGGEEFAYNLQALKRATVVGEVTGGGAHPVKPFRLNEHFEVFVPFARAVNPTTKANWEERGVKPDVIVSADSALNHAYLSALQTARSAEKDPLLTADQDRAIVAARRAISNVAKN